MAKDFDVDNTFDENEVSEDRKFTFLLFIFITILIILVSTVTFSLMNKYNVGSTDNTIDVGSVLFSFNESTSNIELINVLPISDAEGMVLSGNKEYFDFNVSVDFRKANKNKNLTYEVSLVPISGNTVDGKYVRVYLEENGKGVDILDKKVNSFSDLKDSDIRKGGKVLVTRTLTDRMTNSYRFRMWLSDKYNVDSVSRTFKCSVAIDAY